MHLTTTKLYDLMEKTHPEAFANHDVEACREGSAVMTAFLREQLKKEGLELNEDAFQMLCGDFFGSHQFYARQDEINRRRVGGEA